MWDVRQERVQAFLLTPSKSPLSIPFMLKASGLGIQIFCRKQTGLPYDGVRRPSGESPVPSRQFPEHLRLHDRRNLGRTHLLYG